MATNEVSNAERLCVQWVAHWRACATEDRSKKSASPLNAYFLLDRWRDNPVAAAIAADWPVLAEARQPVPDELFQNRPDDAPCLVPWPEWFIDEPDPFDRFRADLVRWLEAALKDVQRRQAAQHFCGIVATRARVSTLVDHLRRLGQQDSPGGVASLLRYQDPRVLQRAWSLLGPAQRSLWMGPIASWWSLAQPWRGWEPSLFQARAPEPAPSAAQWVCMMPPTREPVGQALPHVSIHRMFDHSQWRVAHEVPMGHRVWARFASEGVEAAWQPDGPTLDRLLAAGHRLGLRERQLEDYAWCSWRPEAHPAEREVDWGTQENRATLEQLLGILREQPTARLDAVFRQVTRRS